MTGHNGALLDLRPGGDDTVRDRHGVDPAESVTSVAIGLVHGFPQFFEGRQGDIQKGEGRAELIVGPSVVSGEGCPGEWQQRHDPHEEADQPEAHQHNREPDIC